ncbi:hypothetical protein [uncultured Jatrophihabitans sp.]|uniref:hypothetical protein n=1 Tax=uncultured Jatrophihabitans sp. TaxID=1610747 RepID=UPI0035CC8517
MYPNDQPNSGPRSVLMGHRPTTTEIDAGLLEPLPCEHLLDRVETEGAFVVFGDALAPAERAVWHAALQQGAGVRGMEVTICDTGSFVLLSDGMHSEQVDQIEQTLLDVAAEHTEGAVTAQDPTRNHPSRGRHLRLVSDAS